MFTAKVLRTLMTLTLLSICDVTHAGDIDDELMDLRGEPSRSDLFQFVIAADIAENGPLSGADVGEFDLRGPFSFPDDAITDRTSGLARKDSHFCIDVSHHQGSVDFAPMREQNVLCVYVKATQGIRFKDPRFAENWAKLGSLPDNQRLHRGAYHFLSADTDPAVQANNFVRFVKRHGGLRPGDMPPVLDLEWDIGTQGGQDRWKNYSGDEIIQKALTWLQIVEEAAGKPPMVYTARSWWRDRVGHESKFQTLNRYMLWIADYSRSSAAVETPKTPNNASWHLWQFTDRAYLSSGYDQRLDANIFKGSFEAFERQFGLE